MAGRKRIIGYLLFLGFAGALALAACQNYLFMEEKQNETATQRDFIPIESISKSDILFIVDNSGSMEQEQANLAENFRAFMEEVTKGQNDFHIGIITTDMNVSPLLKCEKDVTCLGVLKSSEYKCLEAMEDGVAVKKGIKYCMKECSQDSDCPVSYDVWQCDSTKEACTPAMCGAVLGFDSGKKFCVPENNGRLRSCRGPMCTSYKPGAGDPDYQKIMTDKLRKQIGDEKFQAMFQDNVRVGIRGNTTEKGLNALRAALDPSFIDPITGKNLVNNENAGFLRPDAKLTLILVSDEEDCSYDPAACPDCADVVENNPVKCYPDPNTCHQTCRPDEPKPDTLKCNTGFQIVKAQATTDMVREGRDYCLKPCAKDSDCPKSSELPPYKCAAIDGFGSSTYCMCPFSDPVANADSKFGSLTRVSDYSDFLKSLKPMNNERVNMAVIIGAGKNDQSAGSEPPENCMSPDGVACAGSRYYGTASGLFRFFSDSICRTSFKDTLVKIVQFLVVSNEQEMSGKPIDPKCVQVKINGKIIPRCGSQTDPDYFISCRTTVADGGDSRVKPCPEAQWLCDPDDRCADQNGKECTCADLSNTDKTCLCQKTGGACKRTNYWQYEPETCPDSFGKPKVYVNGCGLAAGDKLEVNFLRGGSTAGAGTQCE